MVLKKDRPKNITRVIEGWKLGANCFRESKKKAAIW